MSTQSLAPPIASPRMQVLRQSDAWGTIVDRTKQNKEIIKLFQDIKKRAEEGAADPNDVEAMRQALADIIGLSIKGVAKEGEDVKTVSQDSDKLAIVDGEIRRANRRFDSALGRQEKDWRVGQ